MSDESSFFFEYAKPILGALGGACAGALGGWLGAALRFTNRVSALETKMNEAHKSLHSAFDKHASDNAYDKREIEKTLAQLKEDLAEMLEDMDEMRKSSTDFAKDAELAKFIMDQGARWERMQNAIGRIEGWLRTTLTQGNQ